MKGLLQARLVCSLDLLKMPLLVRLLDWALRDVKIPEKKSTQNQQFSSVTMYRETSNSSSQSTVRKEPVRRREKFSFKKSIVGTGNFKSCQWPIGDPLEEGFHYCGCQNIPTKPYCIEHYKKAYNVDEKYLDRLLDFLHEKN